VTRDEYRRRAKTCFDAASAAENEQTRAALLELALEWQGMAENWDRPPSAEQVLAEEWRRFAENLAGPPSVAPEKARPILQQQQQIRPKGDDNSEP
jgi:hypothetical protein